MLISQYSIKTESELNNLVNDYIFRYYNHKRPHSYLRGITPFQKRNF
ncbi:IS3 family transposase [Garciella nitratireducens]